MRRRLMIKSANHDEPGGRISDYVQDNLIFHLDGKQKGDIAGAWSNLAGSGSFTNYGATSNNDHFYFDGVDDYMRSTSFSSTFFPTRTSGTIEVVIDNENLGQYGIILIPRGATRMAAGIQSDGRFLYAADTASARSYYCPIVTITKGSFSVSSARHYENGNEMSLSTTKTYIYGINASYNYIGKRHSNEYYFKGKIYSIRVYNKQLTEAEVMQNLAVDNIRFNLGLTL